MKAEELMIGDLVMVNRDVCIKNNTIVRVCGIDATNRLVEKGLEGSATCVPVDDIDFYSGGIWVKYLSPIPLTPEILEKNFVSSDNTFGLKNYELGQDYILEDRGDRFGLVRLLPGHRYSTFYICYICHVHQLQHALRLYGIDKEIVVC